MFKTINRFFHGMAWLMAIIGGAVLAALVLMICVSILGRTLSSILHSAFMQGNMPGLANWLIGAGVGPVTGDYELLTAGLAFVVFAFMGWCQITGGHATVDVFISGLRDRPRRILMMVIEIVFAAALILVAVQLYEGMGAMMRRRSTTFLLQYPIWWNYAVAVVPAVIAAVIGTYVAMVRVAEVVTNRNLVTSQGADH